MGEFTRAKGGGLSSVVDSPWFVDGSTWPRGRGTKPAVHIQFPTDSCVDLMPGGAELSDSSSALKMTVPTGALA